MNFLSLFVLGAIGLLALGCEQHPLPGEPPAQQSDHAHSGRTSGAGEQHSGGKPVAPAETRDSAAQPAGKTPEGEPAKPAEAPKFFPGSPEKK